MATEFKRRNVGDVRVIDVYGDVTFETEATLLQEKILESLPHNKKILVNLEKVKQFDQKAEGVLFTCLLEAEKVGGTLRLLHVKKSNAIGLVALTRFYINFEAFDDEAFAIRSFC